MNNTNRTIHVKSLFSYFNSNHIPFCVAGDTKHYPYHIPSDIDIIISNDSVAQIVSNIFLFSKYHNAQFVQLLKHEQTAFYFILAWANDEYVIEYIQPDICSDYFQDGHLIISAEDFLSKKEIAFEEDGSKKDFFIPSPDIEFIYYFTKKIRKRELNQDHFTHLLDQFLKCPDSCRLHLDRLLSPDESENVANWLNDKNFLALKNAIPCLYLSLKRKRSFNIKFLWRELIRKIYRFLYPTGLIISFLGPDGSGKSTLGDRLIKELSPIFRGNLKFHLRPYFFGNLNPNINNISVNTPHSKKPRGVFASIVKLFFFFFDYFFGYWFKIYPLKVRTHLVLFDRYFHDLMIDPLRYRYSAPICVVKLISLLIPEPDLFIILDAPSDIIQSRKNEVSLSETNRQRDFYIKFANSKTNCIIVNTDNNIEYSVKIASKALLNYMENRLKMRMGIN